jgi:hypothetical protein
MRTVKRRSHFRWLDQNFELIFVQHLMNQLVFQNIPRGCVKDVLVFQISVPQGNDDTIEAVAITGGRWIEDPP